MPFATFALLTVLGVVTTGDFFRATSFDDALALAAKEKRIVLVDFFTTWCAPCKKLDSTTWKDLAVIQWAEQKCVAIKVDAEKETKLAERFKVSGYPTILLLKADGTEIDRLVGFRDAKTFLSEAEDALAGKDAVARAKDKLVGHENDPMARQAYADELAAKGRHDEALTEYLWCFDHGDEQPAYVGVRGSFLLGDIARLGGRYPPATKALENRRDAAEARLVAGSFTDKDVLDVVAINRALNSSNRSLSLYDKLRTIKPLSLGMKLYFGRELLRPLVDAKRYQDVLDLFDRPEGYVTGKISIFASTLKIDADNEEMKPAMARAEAGFKRTVVEDCSKMYEAVLGAHREEIGARIADALIAFAPSGATYSTLIASAGRAGAHDVARTVGERGLASLPEPERRTVREALASVGAPK